jgi:hypothetical protein
VISKVSKALTEVLDWKENIYEERKYMTLAEWARMSKENSAQVRKGLSHRTDKEEDR